MKIWEVAFGNIRWHNAIAGVSGSELWTAMLFSVSHAVRFATSTKEYYTTDTRTQGVNIHARGNCAARSKMKNWPNTPRSNKLLQPMPELCH